MFQSEKSDILLDYLPHYDLDQNKIEKMLDLA